MKKLSLNRNQLKYLVIVAMLIDHVAWSFVPTASVLGQVMHMIGRLTGPTMTFFLAEGYRYTRDVKRYALRLGIFALVSWVPFSLYETGGWPCLQFGVIYTLFLGLLAIWFWDKARLPRWGKVLGVALLCVLSIFGDWAFFDVLWPLFFFLYREDEKSKWISYCVVALFASVIPVLLWGPEELFQLGVYLVPPLLHFCYNGEGGSKKPIHKWFFYIFYPAHLLILAYLQTHL